MQFIEGIQYLLLDNPLEYLYICEIFILSTNKQKKMKQILKKADFLLLWSSLAICALFSRPLMPIDETRYISVAWEMLTHKHFLIPILNGTLYAHKPPLLFWLIDIAWSIFGPVLWIARLIPMLISLADLFLVQYLARQLWPDASNVGHRSTYLLLAMPLWAIWNTLVMFDMLLIFFILIGAISIVRLAQGENAGLWNYTFIALATAGGIMTKGPVFLIHISAIIIAYILSFGKTTKEKTKIKLKLKEILLSILVGTIPVILWLVIAISHANNAYATEVLWHQTIGRAMHSFAHARPFWWYLVLLPLIFFPWIFSKTLWIHLFSSQLDKGEQFSKIWFLATIIIFSMISGKQGYYLLPSFIPFALFLSRQYDKDPKMLSNMPWIISIIVLASSIMLTATTILTHIYLQRLPFDLQIIVNRISISDWLIFIPLGLIGLYASKKTNDRPRLSAYLIIGTIILFHIGALRNVLALYDISSTAKLLGRYQREGMEIAIWPGRYAGQFSFLGKLKKPLTDIDDKKAALKWAQTHKEAIITAISKEKDKLFYKTPPLFTQPFRGKNIYIWNTTALIDKEGKQYP